MPYTETALYCDSAQYANVAQWAASHAYSVGNIVRQTAPAAQVERCYVCIAAGTSLSTEPSWNSGTTNTTKGVVVTETGGPKWQEITGVPAMNGDSIDVPAWHASAGAMFQGSLIKNTAGTYYFVTTGGTGGTGAEPAWNTASGATTTDGSVTWTCLGPISNFSTPWAAPAKMLFNPIWNGSLWQVNANMTVYVGDDHTETLGSSYVPPSACQVLSVDHTAAFPLSSANLKPGATINQTANSFWVAAVNGYVYGVQFLTTPNLFGGGGLSHVRFENCTFSNGTTGSAVRITLGDNTNVGAIAEYINCVFSTANAGSYLGISGNVKFENCSLAGSFGGSANAIFSGNGSGSSYCNFLAEGCDFAANVSSGVNLVATTSGSPTGYFLFKDCAISSSLTNVFRGGDATMPISLVIDLNRCDSGGATYRNERHSAFSTETSSSVVVRTGGAADGATPISHQIMATANVLFALNKFNAIPLTIWNAVVGGNRNVTLFGVAVDSRIPNNDEFWFDVEYLGTAGSTKGSYARGGKSNVLAAGSPLMVDTSAWDSAAAARANSTAYTVGQVIKTASNPGRVFACITSGTSAGSEPGGYATAVDGGSVTDGTATFRAGCRFSQTLSLGGGVASMATLVVTWNPSDESGITLSGGDLVATSTASAGNVVRANITQPSGSKFYFEVTLGGADIEQGTMIGIGLPSATLPNLGSGACIDGAAVTSIGGYMFNGENVGSIGIGSFASGDTACVSVDLSANKIWFRRNAGQWNGSSTANPDTGAGGLDISSVFSGAAALPFFCANGTPPVTGTANFTTASFAYTPPTTFKAPTSTIAGPQPQQAGYLYCMPKIARPSMTFYLDPLPVLS